MSQGSASMKPLTTARHTWKIKDMQHFSVAEHFISINGESRRAGELAHFIRFTGCNLRCGYCDTKWALAEDAPHTIMTTAEITETVHRAGIRNVTLTGGEPLIQKGITELLVALTADPFYRVEIETNGAVDIRPFLREGTGIATDRISMTVDYKGPGSGMEDRMFLPDFEAVRRRDTVKFVVACMPDLDRMTEIISRYQLTKRCQVYVSCVFGAIDPKDVIRYMESHRLNDVRFQLQMHKFIWPPDKRGV